MTSEELSNDTSEENRNLHIINMFLEIFGTCQILDETNAPITAPKIVKLNWEVLPAGEYPWTKAKSHVEKVTSTLKSEEKEVIEYRIQRISRFTPDFLAVGNGGFHGYFILGFKRLNLYVLESIHLGNATYIFDKNWQNLSQLTKKEILDENLHHSRIIHNHKWTGTISYLLNK